MGIFLCLFIFLSSSAQPVPELRVRQSGKKILIRFPKLVNRSAVKLIQQNGNLVRGVLIDEGLEQYTIDLDRYQPGVHYIILENRLQRFAAQLILY